MDQDMIILKLFYYYKEYYDQVRNASVFHLISQ